MQTIVARRGGELVFTNERKVVLRTFMLPVLPDKVVAVVRKVKTPLGEIGLTISKEDGDGNLRIEAQSKAVIGIVTITSRRKRKGDPRIDDSKGHAALDQARGKGKMQLARKKSAAPPRRTYYY